jgi:peptidoglycan/xylan/chitin deacetylase (PgdA/CDA1 family)
MKNPKRKFLSSLAQPLKLRNLIRWSGQGVIFPFYHTVSDQVLPHITQLYHLKSKADFERDLDQLLKFFEPLSLEEYLDRHGEKRAKPSMVLSFDDGLKGCHKLIAPLLKRKGIPATFFLNNKFIDNKALFYRYKASLLIHQLRKDCRVLEKFAIFLKIPHEQVEASIRMIGYEQRALLDALAREAELDFSAYLRSRPVYMNSDEIKDLLDWGFSIGAHSSDHIDFRGLKQEEMREQVEASIKDLQLRFDISTRYFSFPFTSDGVSKGVVNSLLDDGVATVMMGTSGLKRTGKAGFIQRIPMEQYETSALEALKVEYLYYLLKAPLGRNSLRY